MPVNINSGAAGNPLDALLAGRNIFGSTGFNIENALAQSYAGDTGVRGQLSQFGTFGTPYDDTNTFNPTNPAIDSRGRITLDGKNYAQLANTNIGGPGEAIDPSKVIFNDQYGLITDPSNIKAPSDVGDWVGPAIIAASTAAMGAYAGGLFGGAAESGDLASSAGIASTDAAESGGTLALNAAGTGVTPYVGTEGLAAAGAAPGGTSGASSASGATGAAPGASGAAPASGEGGNFLSQLNTARQAFGGAQSILNLLGGKPSGGGMDLSSLSGILGLLGLGHQALGGGIGTASGATDAANHAASLADPYGASGVRQRFTDNLTQDRVNSLLNPDPSQILQDPAYQFALSQGTNAINLGDAAQGTLRSGNRGVELEQFGTGLASQYEQQLRNNNFKTLDELSNLAGVNAGSPAAAGQMVMGGFNNASDLRNGALNGLFSGGSNNPLTGGGGLLSLLGNAGSSLFGTNGLFGQLFGSSGLSDSDISSLVSNVGGGSTSDDLFGGFDLGDSFGDAFAGV